jgi:hypothetical protein
LSQIKQLHDDPLGHLCFPELNGGSVGPIKVVAIVGRATLKMFCRKSKTQFVKQERNSQNAIALLNYLKRIAPQY